MLQKPRQCRGFCRFGYITSRADGSRRLFCAVWCGLRLAMERWLPPSCPFEPVCGLPFVRLGVAVPAPFLRLMRAVIDRMWRSVPLWDAFFSGCRCCGNLDEVAAVGAHVGAMFAMGVTGKASSRASALLQMLAWPALPRVAAVTWWSCCSAIVAHEPGALAACCGFYGCRCCGSRARLLR